MYEFSKLFFLLACSLLASSDPQGSISDGTCGQVPLVLQWENVTSHYNKTSESEAIPHSIPWIANLRSKGWWRNCSGALLRINAKNESDIILTSAICAQNWKTEVIHLGALFRDRSDVIGEVAVMSTSFRSHPKYNFPFRWANDIAVIKLAKTVKFSQTIQPICLPHQDEKIPTGKELTVAGWNNPYYGYPFMALQQITVIEAGTCKIHNEPEPELLICARHPKGKKNDPCGKGIHLEVGSLVYLKEAQGTVLHGIAGMSSLHCGESRHRGLAGIYTRVSKYVDWIQKQICDLTSVKNP